MRASDVPLLEIKHGHGVISRRSELRYMTSIANALLCARGLNGLALTLSLDEANLSINGMQTAPPFRIASLMSIAAPSKFQQITDAANLFRNLQGGPGVDVVKSESQVTITLAPNSNGSTSGSLPIVPRNRFPLMTFKQWNAIALVFNAMLMAFGQAGIDVHISKSEFVFAMDKRRLEEIPNSQLQIVSFEFRAIWHNELPPTDYRLYTKHSNEVCYFSNPNAGGLAWYEDNTVDHLEVIEGNFTGYGPFIFNVWWNQFSNAWTQGEGLPSSSSEIHITNTGSNKDRKSVV